MISISVFIAQLGSLPQQPAFHIFPPLISSYTSLKLHIQLQSHED